LFISAFNEEKVIRRKIENSLTLDYPRDRFMVLVASDGSDDRTVEIASEYADQGVEVFHFDRRRGKSAVINDVMDRLGFEVVVFTDANSLLARDALMKLARHFADPQVGCVVGRLRYVDRHTGCVGKGEGVYWRYESKLRTLESRLGRVLVANGSIFAIRKDLFRPLFPEVANDFQLPLEIASRGYKVIYDPEAVALERSSIFWEEEFQRKVRIVLRGITGFSKMAGRLRGMLAWQFLSHKLLRWSAGLFAIAALVANAFLASGNAFYQVVLLLQILFYLAALNGWRLRRAKKTRRLFYIPFYFAMVNAAALVAAARFLSGQRLRVWEKAESTRFSPVPSYREDILVAGSGGEAPIGGERFKVAKR